jgi:hypothetical protein
VRHHAPAGTGGQPASPPATSSGTRQ